MSKAGKAFWNWEGKIVSAMQAYGQILTNMPNDEFVELAGELLVCRNTVGCGPGSTPGQIKKYELLNHSEELFKKLAIERKVDIPQFRK